MSDAQGKPAAPDVLFSAAEIAARLDEMAGEIAAALGDRLVAVPVLNGALIFAADLMRALWRAGVGVELMPLRIRSYGASTSAEQPPELVMALDAPLGGRTALLIDGVCDSGHTLAAAIAHLKAEGAGRVAAAVLIDKPARRTAPVTPGFVGFTAGDQFVVGYGMDAAGTLRHLPYVGVMGG